MEKYSLLFLILFSVSLLSIPIFISHFEFAYYGHNIAAGIIAMVAGVVVTKGKAVKIGYPAPLVALVIYAAWTVWDRNSAVPVPFYYGWMSMPVGVLLLGAYIVLFSNDRLPILSIGRMVGLLVAGEGIVCLLQYGKLIDPPGGELYKVSGTLANPNLTAMFIAMAIPLLLFTQQNDRGRFRFISFSALVLSVVALLLLQSRSAAIGVSVAIASFFAAKYQWAGYVKAIFRSKWRLTGAILLLSVFFTVLVYGLYHYKKESSDSRIMIWKISLEMVARQPISGYGYYSYEQTYNLAQAAYFESGRGTEQEKNNAAHIRIGYNDFIQNMVEGGIVGFLLYLFFIGCLLYAVRSRATSPAQTVAYSGVLVFTSMSLFNTAELTIPVFSMLILYTGILTVGNGERTHHIGKWPGLVLVLLAILVVFYQLNGANASFRMKKALEQAQAGRNDKALDLLKPLGETLRYSEKYWTVNGLVLQNMKKYDLASDNFNKALALTSSPETFIRHGECLMEIGRYDEAIQRCSTALYIAPSRLLPRYTLMKIYERQMDTIQALRLANEVLLQTPKGTSKKADFYKKKAQKLIESYNK